MRAVKKVVTPIDIQVVNRLLSSVAEEMGIVLQRSAFSSNIKERRDFSCAIFDRDAKLLAQAAHIPVHLGAMPDVVRMVRDEFRLDPGDIVITNDPFRGGTHLPDITLISGVFDEDDKTLLFYLAARAHHADVGAKIPGSMGLSTSLDEEGVLISPAYLAVKGKMQEEFFAKLIGAMRNPSERSGDLRAQVACLYRGQQRLKETLATFGKRRFFEVLPHLIDYGRRFMSAAISQIPDGNYTFTDYMDDDGMGSQPVPITATLTVRGDEAAVDFTGTAPQAPTCINATLSVTRSAVFYCFFCLVGEGYPVNAGSLEPVTVIAPEGCLLNPRPPAPVAAGNVETSQRIVDTVLGALSKALPEKIPAAGCGTMNNIAIGSASTGQDQFTYYETIGGGMGASSRCDGMSGVQVHMTNTLNTPVEALEQTYPMMIERYGIRDGSGGKGRHRGGDGLIRRYRFLAPCTVSLLTERRVFAPYGLYGGEDGKRGANLLFRKGQGSPERLPGKCVISVEKGDCLEIRSPGGGGYGVIEP
ncbi:MAG: hydantoinase B/oxoprolinase family protein [Thermodesulfobacteria bacterium]|nr:hydantoinase B/oxoprolinase family protein [Thermodesulfobacteriota bacterium]